MSVPKLVLHPADPCAAPLRSVVVDRLGGLGLISRGPRAPGDPVLRVGERFLSLVTFLGCSPAVATAPRSQEDEQFCHVRVTEPADRAVFRMDRSAPAPRCPRCRTGIDDREGLLVAWRSDPAGFRWRCPNCGAAVGIHEINWRQAAGAARLFVEIWNVHPSEAVPGEQLLAALAELSGGPWEYFYCRD
jgi:hypothetical protein